MNSEQQFTYKLLYAGDFENGTAEIKLLNYKKMNVLFP